MKNNFDNINEMVELIQDELPECECDENFKCKECSELEEGYCKASNFAPTKSNAYKSK